MREIQIKIDKYDKSHYAFLSCTNGKFYWGEMADFDYDDSDEWVQQEFLPMGSEGSLQMSIWHNPIKNEMASTTVSVFGDLRDYGGSDDIERLEQWFAKCCENNWTRQAVMQVIDEYCDKPTIFQYIQN